MAPIATEIQRLREEIEAHNYAYYVLSAPTISDYDFDQLLKQLERLEWSSIRQKSKEKGLLHLI